METGERENKFSELTFLAFEPLLALLAGVITLLSTGKDDDFFKVVLVVLAASMAMTLKRIVLILEHIKENTAKKE